jgi:hypothetical protein
MWALHYAKRRLMAETIVLRKHNRRDNSLRKSVDHLPLRVFPRPANQSLLRNVQWRVTCTEHPRNRWMTISNSQSRLNYTVGPNDEGSQIKKYVCQIGKELVVYNIDEGFFEWKQALIIGEWNEMIWSVAALAIAIRYGLMMVTDETRHRYFSAASLRLFKRFQQRERVFINCITKK